jgi:thiol-disulfide isomerase/thioredoxin
MTRTGNKNASELSQTDCGRCCYSCGCSGRGPHSREDRRGEKFAARYISACVNLLGSLSGDEPNLAYTEVAQRKLAPDVVLGSIDGSSIQLWELQGKVVLLTFSKTNCVACDTEMQWFTEFQETHRERDFLLLNHQVTAVSDEVLPLFGSGEAIPTTFLIDSSCQLAVPCRIDVDHVPDNRNQRSIKER